MGFKALRRAPGWLPPVAVLLLALLPRLWQIDLTRFFNDQVDLLQWTARWLDDGSLPLTNGMTFAVTSAHQPPLITYLLAAPMLISRNPAWVSGCAAALDALAAPLLYLAGKRMTGSTFAGVSAGVLYALSPGAIAFGRMLWNSDLTPIFSAVALFGLIAFVRGGQAGCLVLSLVALSWQIQLHIDNVVLALPWLAAAIWRWRQLRVKPLAAGVVVALLPLAPYAYLQVESGWSDIRQLAGYGGLPKATDLAALLTVANLAGPATYGSLLPGAYGAYLQFVRDPLTLVLLGLLLLGLVWTCWRPNAANLAAVAWLALPILAAIRHTSDPRNPADGVGAQYVLSVLPALALLQAQGLYAVWMWAGAIVPPKARMLRLVPDASLAALAAVLGVAYFSFQQQVEANVLQSSYGMPLRYSMRAADIVRDDAGDRRLYLAAPFYYNRTVPALAGVADYAWYPDGSVFVFPRTDAAYLAESDTMGFRFLADHFSPPLATVRTAEGNPELGLFAVPASAASQVFAGPAYVPVRAGSQGALAIQGYLAEPFVAGQRSTVSVLWRVLDPSLLPARLSLFAHLVDAAGSPISTAPDMSDSGEPWQAGDLAAASFDLNIKRDAPSGGYWLEIGFYDTFSQQRLAGDGSAIRVGPLKVHGQQSPPPTAPPLATFDNGELALLSADWQGQQVAVDWRALRRPAASYTVFVHAVDAAGKLVGQWDGVPRGGSYPTNLWDAGEVVHDAYAIGVRTAPGLHLEIGLYTQPDVKRLPVSLPGRSESADHVSVGTA